VTPTTEQRLLQISEDNRDRLQRLETAILDENGEGRLPVVERRTNDHAARLKRLEIFAAMIIAGGTMLLWELKTLIDGFTLIANIVKQVHPQ
jgi:hypothetical protein